MGVNTTTVSILSAMGAFIVLVALLGPSPLSAQGGEQQAGSAKPLIEIRFARRTPASGYQPLTLARSGQVVHVSKQTTFTDGDFEHVEARITADGLVLSAQWQPASAQRMASIKRGEEGAGEDFLAVFVGGELLSAPRIVLDPTAMAARVVDIGLQVPPDKAERIAHAVGERWPE